MNGEITWAGVAISTLGDFVIESPPETNRPERKVDRYKVPGRNGDIVVFQDAWQNVTRSYDLEIRETGASPDYNDAAEALAAWLYAPSGYQRLTDSFDALVYRRAYVSEDTRIRNLVNTDGRCTIEFECDPRRFLLTGETPTTLNGTGTITNPTKFTARPTITVYGSGSGTIAAGGNTITISSITTGMILDCENYNAYYNNTNLNSVISGSFPIIPTGAQTITITGGITSIKVVPNWWSI